MVFDFLRPGLRAAALALCAGLAAASAAAADDAFPSKPIKFIVPFGPGSGTDTSARYFGKHLQELTGQPVIVENRPGANGFIAVQQVLQAPADGYTVFVGSNSTLAVNVALFKSLPYDPQAQLAPLTVMMRAPAVLVVPADSPYTSMQALIAGAKSRPGKLNYGAGSAGYQLMAELFNDMAQVSTTHVPFKSAAEALTAVASGTVDLAFADITAANELIKAGRLRALAIAADERSPAQPDLPTTAQAGLPGYAASVWVASAVAAQTPKARAERLAELMTQIERMPQTREFYARIGAQTMHGGPEEMRRFQAEEIALWKRIAEKAGIAQQ